MNIISENNPDAVSIACESLKNGEIISFSTDTIYGIACDASNDNAVENLYKIKKRDAQKPISIFVKDLTMAEEIFLFDETSKKIAENFLPGNITLILQKKLNSSINLARNLNTQDNSLGFRIPKHTFTNKLMSEFKGVLAVSSANFSNEKPSLNAKDVENYFINSTLNLLIDGDVPEYPKASTVIKIINNKVEILRHGDLTTTLQNFL